MDIALNLISTYLLLTITCATLLGIFSSPEAKFSDIAIGAAIWPYTLYRSLEFPCRRNT